MEELLFKAFYQGKDTQSFGAGNCASIALIKAAILTFGFDVFNYSKQDEIHQVELKNGEKLVFTDSELEYASKEASFILGETQDVNEKIEFEKIRSYAYLCFTSICKMAQKHGDYSKRLKKFIIPDSFELAVEIINDGTYTPLVYEFLGLEDYTSPIYRMKLNARINSNLGMILWTNTHAMFTTNGYFEKYGDKIKFTGRAMYSLPGKIALGIIQLRNIKNK